MWDDVSAIENQLAILRSDSLLQRVVIKERLAAPPPSTSQGTTEEDAKKVEAQLIQDAINGLRGALTVRRSGHGLCPRYFDHVAGSG